MIVLKSYLNCLTVDCALLQFLSYGCWVWLPESAIFLIGDLYFFIFDVLNAEWNSLNGDCCISFKV